MNATLPKKQMDKIMAEVMNNNISDLRALLTNNGIVNASGFTDDQTRIAVLKAVKDSPSFRMDLSEFMANLVSAKASFVAEPMNNFVNQPLLNFAYDDLDTVAQNPNAIATAQNGGAAVGGAKSSFWNTLGGLASKENLQSLFNSGLNAASTSLQNKANKDSEERALELERLRLQQIQAQKDLADSGGLKTGLSTGAIIGISLGAVALIVTIILVTRKKK